MASYHLSIRHRLARLPGVDLNCRSFQLLGATCARPEFAGDENLWCSFESMTKTQTMVRWVRAAALCDECPVLDECRRRRDWFEVQGLDIDGVVAGRIPGHWHHHLTACKGCGRPMAFRGEVAELPAGFVWHARDGRCRPCQLEPRRKAYRKKQTKKQSEKSERSGT